MAEGVTPDGASMMQDIRITAAGLAWMAGIAFAVIVVAAAISCRVSAIGKARRDP